MADIGFNFPTVARPFSTIYRYDSIPARKVPMTARPNSTADRPVSTTASINSTVYRSFSTPDRPNSTGERSNLITYRSNSTTANCHSDTYSINSTIGTCNSDTYCPNSTKNSLTKEPALRIAAHLQFAQARPQAKNCKRAALPRPKRKKKIKNHFSHAQKKTRN